MQPPSRFLGLNELDAFLWPICGIGIVSGPMVLHDLRTLPLALALTFVAAGSWYWLTIDDTGIRVVFFVAWIVPIRFHRFGLDARVNLYEAFDANQPEGLCIDPRSGGEGTDCFGPHFGQARIARRFEALTAALLAARARVADEALRVDIDACRRDDPVGS
jgi:hypothetical protein